MKPKEIRRSQAGLYIVWGDDKQMNLPASWLRKACRCAECLERTSDSLTLYESKQQLESTIRIDELELIGNYALGVRWGDGHRSLLAFDRVRMDFENLKLPEYLASIPIQVKEEAEPTK